MLTSAAKLCKYLYLSKLQALMFTVWCCRGNPDGLFDFHLSASHRFSPLFPLCGHRLSPPVRGKEGGFVPTHWGCIFYVSALCSQLAALRNMCASLIFSLSLTYIMFFEVYFRFIFLVHAGEPAYVMLVNTGSRDLSREALQKITVMFKTNTVSSSSFYVFILSGLLKLSLWLVLHEVILTSWS